MSGAEMSIVIVGAGPAGACLAYLLASRGISVTLLERQKDFSREFRGEALLPSGVEALHQIGLGNVLASIPHNVPQAFELYSNTRLVFREKADAIFTDSYQPTFLSQPAFLKEVIDAARAFPNFQVKLGVTVTGLLKTNDRVAGVTLRGADQEQTLPSTLVIGADGRNSIVRRACNLDARKHGVDIDVVWCKTSPPAFLNDQNLARMYIGRGHLLIAYRAPDGLLQVAWIIKKGTYGELRQRGISEWVEAMAHHVTPDLGVHLRMQRHALKYPFLLSVVSDRVTRWSAPGALVIGDAAHTMSPVGGQGINMALRDAIVTANHLVPLLQQTHVPDRIDTATSAVENERTPELEYIQRLQAMPPRLIMGQAWWAAAFRETVPRLLRFRLVRQRAGSFMRGMSYGHGDVRLQI